MPDLVTTGALLQCSMGAAPAPLTVIPGHMVMIDNKPAATTMDFKPMANIPSFGVCRSIANPQVAAATSAAAGVLTPMPCVPATSSPWVPGAPTVTAGNMPVLTSNSQCMCMWAGVITIKQPGTLQKTVK
ncbi:MAG: DUF4280 domain-containing protein [Myxococcota bacterium]|jgi:hypothetical protein|nr:DUF4280 domain-containing protein [Myxococcota bacterium]